MDELRSLKSLYDDGYMIESEYNRRRLQLINKITGKNYTLEDILKAENKSSANKSTSVSNNNNTPSSSLPNNSNPPSSTSNTIYSNKQTSSVSQQQRPAMTTLAAPTPINSLPDPNPINNTTQSQNTLGKQQSFDFNPSLDLQDDLVLEEIPADQLEIWDDLDSLSLNSTPQINNNQSNTSNLNPTSNNLAPTPSTNLAPTPTTLAPTPSQPPTGVSPSNRAMLKRTDTDDSNPSGANGLKPTNSFNPNSQQQSTLRTTPQQSNQASTLRQTPQGQTLRQPVDANNMNTMNMNQMNMQNMGMNQMGMPGQMGINTSNSMYGNQMPNQMGMNTMYGNQMPGQMNQMGMPGQMGINTSNSMYGNQMSGQMGMNTMYGNQMGMPGQMGINTSNSMYGNQMPNQMNQMGMNTMYGNQMPGQMNQMNQMGMNQGTMRPTNNVRATMNAAPSEFRTTPSLESNAMAAKPSSRELLDKLRGKQDTNIENYTWEFFHAAGNNNVKRLNDLLELGVDVNQIDTDTGNTALHMACTKGQKHALFFLVDQGADIEAQNKKGSTPLHLLVTHRFNTLAVWLVKQGADITTEDIRGFTPYDMALPWLQKEMKEAVYGRQRSQKTQQQINRTFGALAEDLNPELQREVNYNKMQDLGVNWDTIRAQKESQMAPGNMGTMNAGNMGTMNAGNMGTMNAGNMGTMNAGNMATMGRPGGMQNELAAMDKMSSAPSNTPQSTKPLEQEVMKIYTKNKGYKSLLITSETKAGDVCQMMAEKLNMAAHATSFDLVDVQKDQQRRLDPLANLFKIKKFWPLILGKSGNETSKHCYFMVLPKRGTSAAVQKQYRKAIS